MPARKRRIAVPQNSVSSEHQWDHLDARLGKDQGASKERAKLFLDGVEEGRMFEFLSPESAGDIFDRLDAR